ncbi:MAG: hypothetical protein ACJ8NS_06225 [Chthoniobacterales bacterium]
MRRQADSLCAGKLPEKAVGEASISFDSKRKTASWEAVAALGVVAILAGGIVFLILRYAVAIPMQDDWEMVALVTKAHTGGLTFADLIEQQQEARPVFPKLIFIALSFGKYWDSRSEMVLSVLICCLTAFGIYRLLGRSGLSPPARMIAFLLAAVLIFSPSQHEIWLLASGFPSFLPALCIVWGILVATGSRPIATKFWVCLILTIGASFSLANGLLAWGLTFPFFLAVEPERPRWRWLGYWLLATAACAACYFWRFHPQPDLPSFAPGKTFIEYWQYVAGFVGSGLGRAGNQRPQSFSIEIGTVLLLVYSCAIIHLIFRWRDRVWLTRVLPWIGLGAYSIGSGCLAAMGRIAWGVAQALESRYVAFSIYLAIAVIALGAIYWTEIRKRTLGRGPGLVRFACAAFLTATFFTFELLCAVDSVAFFRVRSAGARISQSAVLFSPVLDTSETIKGFNYPRPEWVRENAEALDRLHLLRTRLIGTRELAKLRHTDVDDRVAAGWFDGLTTGNDDRRTAVGWAAFPARNRPADAVVLAFANEQGDWIAFAHSDAVLERPDVARVLGSGEQLWSGWRVIFRGDALPKGAEISAWAVDAKEAKLYRLKTKAPILNP